MNASILQRSQALASLAAAAALAALLAAAGDRLVVDDLVLGYVALAVVLTVVVDRRAGFLVLLVAPLAIMGLAAAGLPEAPADRAEAYLRAASIFAIGVVAVVVLSRWLAGEERGRAMAADLRVGERRLRSILDSALDAVVTIDAEGTITDWNPQAAAVFGWPAAEVVGRRAADTIIPPQHRAGHLRGFESVVATGDAAQYGRRLEIEGLHRDGHLFPIELSIAVSGAGAYSAFVRDISARRGAEEALRESERLNALLIEAAPTGIISTDAEGQITRANPAALAVVGSPSEEATKRFNVLTLQATREAGISALYADVIRSKEPRRIEVRYRSAWGKEADVSFHVVPLLSEGDDLVGTIGLIEDVTARKAAERALRESEEQFRHLFANNPHAMWVADRETLAFLEVNEAAVARYGYSRDEFLCLTVRAIREPEDVRALEAAVKNVAGLASAGESRHVLKDGTRIDVAITAHTLDFAGRPAVLVVAQDITARKRAESALRRADEFRERVMESTSDLIAAADLEGNFTLVNRRMCEISGYDEQELIGAPFTKVIAPESLEEARRHFGRAIDGTGVPSEEVDLLRKDGARRTIRFSAWPLLEEGEIVGAVSTAEDVTERKQLEAQYLQAQRLETVGRLAGGVAHDFNNLMTAIIGYAELAMMALPPADALRPDLQEIRDTATRAASLAHQLLAFSRRQIIEPKVIDLNELILGTDRMLRRLIGEDVELVVMAAEGLGRVRVDPGQFEQVLVNLAVNARDAMPTGGKLTIETVNLAFDDDRARDDAPAGARAQVVLRVSDTGVGMSEETRQHAFEPFYTTKERGKGTGLGLATCYGIVEQAGGTIRVYSGPGAGTIFEICLPRVEGPPDGLPHRDDGDYLPGGRETILLVEDEAAVRSMASRVLRGLGYHVLEAANGSEAMRVAGQHEDDIHLLLTDVVMPQMGGKELAERLQQERPAANVLFTSGYADDAIVRHGVLEHAIAFLQKPFSPGTLARKVRESLDREPAAAPRARRPRR